MTGHFIFKGFALQPSLKRILSLTLPLFIFGTISPSLADTQRIVDYTYDGAGNITSIRSNRTGPPVITALQPDFIHKERITSFTVTGVDLLGTVVTTTTSGLDILNINNISATQVEFTLEANNAAVVGSGALSFSTHLGSDTEAIAIIDRLPAITFEPKPVLLTPDGQEVEVKLFFDQPFSTDQVYDLVMQDSSIASVSPQSIALVAGSTSVTIITAGINNGSTRLEINHPSGVQITILDIIITDDTTPPS